MKISILGGSSLAKTLGKKFIDSGIQVSFGVHPEFNAEETEWKMLNRLHHRICPFESSIIQGEIILICSDHHLLPQIWEAFKNSDTANKIIIDCTNTEYESKISHSPTKVLKRIAPKAQLFKAFNNLGADYPHSDPLGIIKEVYFCGDEIPEKNRVRRLIELIGFKAIDAGKFQNASLLEAFYHLGKEITSNKNQESHFHFKLISV
ncbi:hypothetical protein SAMN04488104_10503 [Algoriphagus faecimaris]|uniref:Pyrroline-5-carboxylate reductase catalytic N-terminal domain-containing protein n=1 Tax=Algoriphagus faecimaris TaxID=686796 RepID=A0A1G6X0B5_9BACT|nr:NAD(P)-binding domain-containing protein [Algoriphagus faecimaris]SDD71612.1 hypothetical protein SAMN04488104_10503 [Algoriphagus faecimaris]